MEGGGGGGDWMGDERKDSDTPAPPPPLHLALLSSSDLCWESKTLQVAPITPCDIYGRAPTAKVNVMSFLSVARIVLPPAAGGEE